MAAETGGNVEGSKMETVTTENGVKILGIPNIPGTVATEASALYARNVLTSFETLFDKDKALRLIQKKKSKKRYRDSWRSSTAQARLRRVLMVETITIFVLPSCRLLRSLGCNASVTYTILWR